MRYGFVTINRAPEGEGGGGGPPAAAPQGGGQAPAGGAPVPSAPYRPEGLPDHLFGANERETLDKLWGAYRPARDTIARLGDLGELPKDAASYTLDLTDAMKPYLPGLDADPVFALVREAAHKSGIRDKQFGPFVSGLMSSLIDGDLIQPPVDLAAEKAALVPPEAAALDDAGKTAAVDGRVRQNHATIQLWSERGMPKESAEALSLMLDTAAGNRAVEWFAAQARGVQPTTGGQPPGSLSESELNARMRDPRGQVGTSTFDPAFAKETDRLFQTFYGNNRA